MNSVRLRWLVQNGDFWKEYMDNTKLTLSLEAYLHVNIVQQKNGFHIGHCRHGDKLEIMS